MSIFVLIPLSRKDSRLSGTFPVEDCLWVIQNTIKLKMFGIK